MQRIGERGRGMSKPILSHSSLDLRASNLNYSSKVPFDANLKRISYKRDVKIRNMCRE